MFTQAQAQERFRHRHTPLWDKGFVALMDYMGSDADIDDAARQSYDGGAESRKVSDLRTLIRFLWRHEHSSPFEMGELKFMIKAPITLVRQLIRHRTANINEFSGRYSEFGAEDFYIPDIGRIVIQSASNKQASGDKQLENAGEVLDVFKDSNDTDYATYQWLLEQGLARETARNVLSLGTYTQLVWKIDLRNLLHFLRLRLHPHAQSEIRELAQAMYELLKQTGAFDHTIEAFEDFTLNSMKFSAQELLVLRGALDGFDVDSVQDEWFKTKREKTEFLEKIAKIQTLQ